LDHGNPPEVRVADCRRKGAYGINRRPVKANCGFNPSRGAEP
jgi:hypothetical protein